jgi:hypothetical protein
MSEAAFASILGGMGDPSIKSMSLATIAIMSSSHPLTPSMVVVSPAVVVSIMLGAGMYSIVTVYDP